MTDHSTNFVREDTCPTCGKRMDSATVMPGKQKQKPTPGDISICIRCGSVARFGPDLKLSQASRTFLKSLHQETKREILAAQRAIAELNKRN